MTKLILLIFFFAFSIQAEEKAENRDISVLISRFDSLDDSTTDKKTYILERIVSLLQKNNLKIKTSAENSLESRLREAKAGGFSFLVEGFYKIDPGTGNLNLYTQVYDPQTGYIIDAYNVTDEIIQQQNLKLDPGEIKEEDDTRIERLTKKLGVMLTLNPKKKENRENINDYIVQSNISKIKNFNLQNDNKSSEEASAQVFDLLQNQVTTSATKIARSTNEVPNLVNVISHNEIRNYGRISINDIMYQLPGFAPSQDYDRRTVSSRGMFESWNNAHYMMLMDGVTFNDNQYGSAYTWEITPINIIKSLEIVRGPGSALYGSNATFGVININTFSGSDLKGSYNTRMRAGDHGTTILDFITGDKKEKFSYVLSYNKYNTAGNNYLSYDNSGRTNPFTGLLQQFKTNDARNNDYLFTKIEGEGSLKGLSIQYHKQYWNFQTGHGWLFRVPDFKEAMNQERHLATIKYTNNITDKLIQEYVVRYQLHTIDWNMRLAENNSYAGYYPAGVSEYLKTSTQDWFGRVQYTYNFAGNGASILGGVESDQFLYRGDSEHYSNAKLSDVAGGAPPTTNNAPEKLGQWMQWIGGKPVRKLGTFLQLVSGKLFDRKVEFTLGIRNDNTLLQYKAVDGKVYPFANYDAYNQKNDPFLKDDTGTQLNLMGYHPAEKRTLSSTNPRLGAVFFPVKNLTLKTMAGTAFREPTMDNLFGYNSWTLTSDPRKMKPEKIQTYEGAFDWHATKNLNVRGNYFYTKFENQIAYTSTGYSQLANLYNLTTKGWEFELLYAFGKNLSGFMNYSYNKRLNERIQDKNISPNNNNTTWYPKETYNFGINYTWEKFFASITIQHQGKVLRRKWSDFIPIDPLISYPTSIPEPTITSNYYYRPETVPAWTNVNLRFMYNLAENFQFGFFIMNAGNTRQTLIKSNNYAFDYLREGRRYMFEVNITF